MSCFTCQGRGYILDWDGQWLCTICKGHGTEPKETEKAAKLIYEVRQDILTLKEEAGKITYDCCDLLCERKEE
jgi:DnaJ-class molecular chaperone